MVQEARTHCAVVGVHKGRACRHSAKSKDDRFFCITCTDYVAFATREEHMAHNKEFHIKSGVCPYCPQTFPVMPENTLNYCIKRHILKCHEVTVDHV